jgi:hypothetical protein
MTVKGIRNPPASQGKSDSRPKEIKNVEKVEKG